MWKQANQKLAHPPPPRTGTNSRSGTRPTCRCQRTPQQCILELQLPLRDSGCVVCPWIRLTRLTPCLAHPEETVPTRLNSCKRPAPPSKPDYDCWPLLLYTMARVLKPYTWHSTSSASTSLEECFTCATSARGPSCTLGPLPSRPTSMIG